MEQKAIYRVEITAVWEGEAESTQDATDKADEYYAAHPDEAEHQVTQREVWVENGA